MKRAATLTTTGNEDLNAQSDKLFAPGLVIILDLDRFGEYVEEKGLDPYKPNLITGELTNLVEEFVRKHRGVVVYGLDRERGTEEVVVEIPYPIDIDSIVRDLEEIRKKISSLGVTLSGVVLYDYVTGRPARDRREAYYGAPARRRAVKLLKSIKRKGGDKIIVVY